MLPNKWWTKHVNNTPTSTSMYMHTLCICIYSYLIYRSCLSERVREMYISLIHRIFTSVTSTCMQKCIYSYLHAITSDVSLLHVTTHRPPLMYMQTFVSAYIQIWMHTYREIRQICIRSHLHMFRELRPSDVSLLLVRAQILLLMISARTCKHASCMHSICA